MIRFSKNKTFIVLLLTLLIFTSGVGCNKIFRRPKEQESKQSQDQKKSPPKILVSLENTTETMIKSIQEVMEKRAEATKEEKSEKQGESSQEKDNQGDKKQEDKSGDKEGDKSEGKEKQEEKKPEEGGGNNQQKQESQGSKETQSKTESLDWKRMQKNVEKLQKSWSDYVNMALKDGASNDLVKGYESQLDILTTKVMEEQEDSLLDTANDLYRYYPKFFDLYKHKAPPNIKDMKYHIRKIIIDGEQSQWAETPKSMDDIKQAWDIAKSRMDKPDRDINRRVETAIDSFSRSVKQQNTHLVKLKGNILMDMLEEIK